VLNDVVLARHDAQPRVAWPGVELRRHGDWLHVMAPLPPVSPLPVTIELDRVVDLGGLGELAFEESNGAGLSAAALEGRALTLAFRGGGERIRPAGDAHTRELKKLLQSEGILPWMRGRIPLIRADGRLAAVADLWTAHDLAARDGERAWRVRWSRHPDLR
jgi:tRNA(Ile)-lysidine synthase